MTDHDVARIERRARIVAKRLARSERTTQLWRMERDALVVRLAQAGRTHRQIASAVDLTPPRVTQILGR